MNRSPLVSVIIPTYNDSDVVCDAIDCSLNQTYQNTEVIVVDDGSTDDTESLLRSRYGSRIYYIRQINRGLSSARNAGIVCSSGKYLQFLDSDDLIFPEKIELQVKALENTDRIALAYCDYIRGYTSDPAAVRPGRMSPVLQHERPLDDLILKWETEVSIPPHCFLFDAAIFRGYGVCFDENLCTHEDWECWVNVFLLDPMVVFVDRCLASYRIRNVSMCSNRKKMRKGYLAAIDKQIARNRKNREIRQKLYAKRKQVDQLYRDASPTGVMIERYYPAVRGIYKSFVPERMRRAIKGIILPEGV